MKENKVVINKCYGGFTLSQKALEWLKSKYNLTLEKYDDVLPRHDHRLVECVEALGKDASGDCANLVVVTFLGNHYRICEYDGAEWVETPESINWTVIE